MRMHATKTRSAACAMLLGLLLTLGAQVATAQGSVPTAAVIPTHPSFAAGAPAMFKGRDFTPGETVTFQITHVRGTPVTNQAVRGTSVTRTNHPVQGMSIPGMDHTPAAVTTDRNGAFLATWQVCSTDCVGELLQIEATGQASGMIARAVFMDLSAPSGPGAQNQQVRHADGAASRRADHARANLANVAAAPTFERIETFGAPGLGAYPNTSLIQGTDGALYGTASQGGTFGFGTVFKMNPDGTGSIVIHNFDYSSGGYPNARLVQGMDGTLYGTAYYGGSGGAGIAFKLNTDGSGFTVLKSFDNGADGGSVYSWLLLGTDGALYGAAHQGGTFGAGTLFKLNTDGSSFTVLLNLDYYTTGGYPYTSGLIQGADGTLYGTASGGTSGYGTAFKLNPDGTGFTVLQNFDYTTTGAYLYGGLRLGTDGVLYGTALQGGLYGAGTVYKLNTDGTGFTVLQNFDYSNGTYPYPGLVQGTDGALYGAATYGGTNGSGTAFKLNTDGTGFTVLRNFDYPGGAYPYAGLLQGMDGALYGTAYQGGSNGPGTAFKLNTDGTGFTVLKSFSYGSDQGAGAYPYAGLLEGTDGRLYGTTIQGGTGSYGTVYQLNTDGTGFNVLHNFDYYTGAYPYAARLVQGTDGALYGTTYYGGSGSYGTVFKLNTDGSGFTVLQNFDYSTTGGYVYAGLMQGTDGALYGTAYQGGTSGYGTAFKLNTNGTGFTVLKNFDYSASGGYVFAGLVQGSDGALYGAASSGGSGGYGTVYKLNTDGSGFTVLQNFDYSVGAYPYAGLLQGADGALYGTTYYGGTGSYGTAFKLNPDGTGFSTLQNFDYSVGAYPYAGLLQGTDGTLYGTTFQGGSGGYGTVYKLNPNGSGFGVVKEFDNGADGGYAFAGLMQGTDGNLYGTTVQGGDAGLGAVFRLIFENANHPPVAKCKNVTVSSGAGCAAAASIDDGSSDPDAGDTITLSQSPAGPYALGATGVTLTVTDSHGASSTCTATVTVNDPAPVAAITGPASGSFYAVNTPVSFTGTWADANGGPHTAQWTFDGAPDASFAAGSGTAGSANTSHTFTVAGVYMVSLAVTDNCSAAGTSSQLGGVDEMVVIYDPNAGFVTGGGWIDSPAGAYVPNPALTGKANFGFVSKYKKGASVPTGETEFQYKVGNLNFHSTSYDWLVVSGAKAQYKGTGTINNAGTYKFILTAIDGEISGGGGADKFRMKITETGGGLVYDNLLNAPDSDDPTTLLGGGSIVIHLGGGSMSAEAGAERKELSAIPVEYALAQNFPNPFDRSTLINFSLPERSRIHIAVYDLAGRAVRTLADGEWEPGRHSATMSRTGKDGSTLDAGVYFVRLSAQSLASGRSFNSLKKMVVVR
jgi:uncharacterized repeat protein (TIGR03803 family)